MLRFFFSHSTSIQDSKVTKEYVEKGHLPTLVLQLTSTLLEAINITSLLGIFLEIFLYMEENINDKLDLSSYQNRRDYDTLSYLDFVAE